MLSRFTAPFRIETHAEDGDKLSEGEFIGLASAYGNEFEAFDPELLDVVPTVMEPGAFAGAVNGRVPILRDHDHTAVIGRSVAMSDTKDGLLFHGRLAKTERGLETLELLRAEALGHMSVGFPIDGVTSRLEKREGGGFVRHIEAIPRLREVSIVPFPANELSVVSQVQSAAAAFIEAHADRVLTDAEHAAAEALIRNLERFTSARRRRPDALAQHRLNIMRADLARLGG